MARVVNTGSITYSGAATDSNTAYMNGLGHSWSGMDVTWLHERTQWGYSAADENTQTDFFDNPNTASGSWSATFGPVTADTTIKCRARCTNTGLYNVNGTVKQKKSGAVAATASTPTYSSVTATTATIACNYYPNVNESTCTAQLQIKRTVDSTWTNAGSGNTTGGYSQVTTYSEAVTGLLPSTSYDVRLTITRTTLTGTSLTSATASFTTLAGAPTITTDAATGIGATSATLNSTLDINSATNANVYYIYRDATPPEGGTTTSNYSPQPSADGSYPISVTGLTESTTYYYRAYCSFSTPSGSPVSGSIQSFATPAAPGTLANAQTHVTQLHFDRKYGVATSVYFVAYLPRDSSADKFYTGEAVWGTSGEAQISKDGGAFAPLATAPTHVEGALYKVSLSADELRTTNGGALDEVFILLTDTGGACRDVFIRVRVHMQLGSAEINTTGNILTNAQTQTSYDSNPYTEGSFSGGTGHAGADQITLACKCVVTVNNVTAGVVDQFTVASANCTGVDVGVAETQSSSTGAGVNFSLTPGADNVTASQTATSTALTLTGYGSGHGLSAVKGATGQDINGVLGKMVLREATAQAGSGTSITLDTGAEGSQNDYYNGAIIFIKGGTGAGQARVITDYVASSKIATINRAWDTDYSGAAPFEYVILGGSDMWKHYARAIDTGGQQLAELPSYASNYADLLQYVFQRITYARDQTVVTRTMYQANGSTGLAQQSVDNDGSTEEVSGAISLL